tara:strand:- start:329 stop:472 length:144 start_codon:yes stop_codon:yes gene_type:complete
MKNLLYNNPSIGSVPEWLNGPVLKTVRAEMLSWVRIPPLPFSYNRER